MISMEGLLINCQVLLITSFSCESQGDMWGPCSVHLSLAGLLWCCILNRVTGSLVGFGGNEILLSRALKMGRLAVKKLLLFYFQLFVM